MINLQNLLQTAPKKNAIGVKGENTATSSMGEAENTEFANIIGQQIASSEEGALLQNTNVSPELLKALAQNGEEATPENLANLEKLLNKNELAQLKNQAGLDGEKQALIRKLGVEIKNDVQFTNEDLKNLKIAEEQIIASRKSPSNVQELLNQIKSTNIQEEDGEVVPTRGMPNNQIQLKESDESKEISSPLEFLMNGSKDRKASNGTSLEQDLMVKKDAKTSGLTQNLSAEEFVQMRSNGKTNAEEQKIPTTNRHEETRLLDLMAMNQQNLKNKTMVQTYGKEQGLLQNNIISKPIDLLAKDEKVKGIGNDELKTSEFKVNNEMQAMKNDLLMGGAPLAIGAKELNETQVKTAPTFDMVNIKSNNADEIIKQVSDYIQQSQLAGKDQIDLTVRHQELGQFKINVSKLQGQNTIDMQIIAQSKEAHQFFVRHESELVRSLTQSGIQLADLKVVASQSDIGASSQSQSKQFYQGSQDQNSSSKQWASFESQQFGDGRERRKELWDEYRSRLSA